MNLIQPSDGGGEQKPETDNKESAERNDSPAADSPDNINSTQELTNPSVNDASGSGMNSGNGPGANGPFHPINLPASLEGLPRAEHFPTQRHRWNTNEEIAAVLINFDRHSDWLFKEVKIRPKSGSMLLYSRKKVRYRRDGYCWKKRKDGKTTREDHMKLKVQGTECIYGCYVHSAILPTFHRRCYWLLQNPDIVLVHYLNVPYPDDAKLLVVASVSLWAERKEWSKEELISQLRPMFLSQDEPNLNNELEVSTAETVEAIVSQLMEKQRLARSGGGTGPPALTNGHGVPQQQTPQPAGTGRHHNRSQGEVAHHNKVESSDTMVAAGNLRRLSAGAGSFVRLEPRPPAHSNNQVPPAEVVYDRMPEPPGFDTTGRGCSPPTSSSSSSSSSSSLSSTSVHPFAGSAVAPTAGMAAEAIHHRSDEPSGNCQTEQLVAAKQESIDYNYYSNCNNPSGSSNQPLHSNPSFPSDGGCNSVPFPSLATLPYYPLSNANSNPAGRRTDEMLSGHGYRLPMDCLFNETLDLSQEDIQRTLSANLSHETAFHTTNSNENSASGERSSRPIETCPTSHCDDDLLVNLDAFDMLTEFSDLDCRDTIDSLISIQADISPTVMESSRPVNKDSHQQRKMSPHTSTVAQDPVLTDITDFSPEWSPTEGGSKLLITGSFTPPDNDPYSILFDGMPVPAVWVQLGVLRCFCPPHSAGRVQLQVARHGVAVTNSAPFEYRQLPAAGPMVHPLHSEGPLTLQWTNSLLSMLVSRLESLSTQLISQGSGIDQLVVSLKTYLESGEVELQSAEDQLVSICRQLVTKRWKAAPQSGIMEDSDNQTNLLHLAAALGLLRVICTLLNWRLENSSPWLEREMNPLARDPQGFTPLMWASAHGHRDVVALLAQWDSAALDITDRTGRSVWTLARQRGHHALAEELESRRILSVRRSTTDLGAPPPIQASKPASKLGDSVTTRQMLMAKRSSVDSMPSSSQEGGGAQHGYWRRPNVAKNHKLSRDDRSYSLPLGGGGPTYSSGRNSTGSNISSLAHDPSLSPHMDSTTSLTSGSSHDGLDGLLLTPNGRCSSPSVHDLEGLSDDGIMTDVNNDGSATISQAAPSSAAGAGGIRSGVRRESISSVDMQHLSPLTSIEQNTRVLTLAEQIIAAIPDRIKNETEDMVVGWSPCIDLESSTVSEVQSFESSIDLASINTDGPSLDAADLTFEFNDQQYRYCETATPSSSLSPASSSCLQSPCSFSVNSPSPPPTTADFSEFLQASASLFVRDFSNLTLSDHEQRELYEAAKTIQKAYRSYVGRKKAEEQEKERAAAVIIQNYYRRYKQYVYLKQMTKAAVVIQNQFRSYYYEQKRFKKNLEAHPSSSSAGGSAAGAVSTATYRNYRETSMPSSSGRQSREGTPTSSALKRTYSQRRQHQAARKIQQFMRQSKNKLQRERALLQLAAGQDEKRALEQQQPEQQQRVFRSGLPGIATSTSPPPP